MKQVYVKTAGYLIHLHGYGSARTPVRFNVKEKHLESVQKQLNTQGIQFEVMDYDENAITINAPPHHEKGVKQKDSPVIGSNIDMIALAKVIRLIVSEVIATHPTIKSINDKLEKLIYKKSVSSPDNFEGEIRKVKREAKKKIEEQPEFIPSIKIDEMTIQSKGIFRVEQSDTDPNKAAELLNKLTK